MSRTAAVILAAGAATRFGSAKQLAGLGGETLLDRTVRVALESGCVPLVVLGARAEEIAAVCSIAQENIVINPIWKHGMATSIVAGIDEVKKSADAALLMTCDQPFVTVSHLRELMAHGERSGRPIASFYADRKGVPAYFPSTSFNLLLGLSGDAGARSLLADAESIALIDGEFDIDTPEKLLEAQKLLTERKTNSEL